MALEISARAKLIAAAGIVVVAATGVTMAAFTDTGDVTTTFTAGTLDLKFDADQDGNPTDYAVQFSEGFDNLAPGDTVSYDLLVYNSGTIDAIASMAAPVVTPGVDPGLEDFMTLVVTDVTGGGSSELFSGPLTTATLEGLAIGADGPGNGVTLTFAVTLDAAAPVDVAGQTITVVFPFSATQA